VHPFEARLRLGLAHAPAPIGDTIGPIHLFLDGHTYLLPLSAYRSNTLLHALGRLLAALWGV
jgi:hypothetical protein